jgi:DNA sulfur modification protein DndD
MKTNDGIPQYGRSELKVMYQEGRDWELSKDPEFRVERILPKDIQEYFFFDGEMLDKYFSRGPRENIKKEVFKISQLGLFNSVIAHLENRSVDYAKEVRHINPDATVISGDLNRKKKQLEDEKAKLEELIKESKQAEDLEEDLLADLKKLPVSAGKIKELQEKREQCERRLLALEQGIKRLTQDQLDYLLEYSKVIMSYKCMGNAKELLVDKVEHGEIPPDYKKRFIEGLLEREVCICGTEIKEGKARGNVEKLLEQCTELGEISQELIQEDFNLSKLLGRVNKFKEVQQKIGRDLFEKEKEYEEASVELRQIEDQISGIDDEYIQRLERQYKTAKKKKEELIAEIGMKKQNILHLEDKVEELNRQYKKEIGKIEKHDETKRRIQLCDKCIQAAKSIMVDVVEEIRAQIEGKTKEQFLATVWKKESYQDIIIDEHYNISVLDQNQMESIGTLSAGERQLLALAFMDSLHMVSGFEAPIMIDTPFSRISGEPKLNLAKVLPLYTGGKQIILLMTDQEYTKKVREILKFFVGKELRINFLETKDGNRAEVGSYE